MIKKTKIASLFIFILTVASFTLHSGSREQIGRRSYIKINIGELFIAIRKPSMRSLLNKNFVVRGKIYKNNALTHSGSFGLMRTAIVCCLIDANVLGLKVRHTTSTRRLRSGTWVKIYGRLIRRGGAPMMQLKNSNFSVAGYPPKYAGIRNDFLFLPHKIVIIPKPKDPFIRKWKEKEPFKY